MKKLLLITSFLASQLFAVHCSEEQYSTYFDKNNDRYKFGSFNNTNGDIVIDTKSIEYKKDLQTIKFWAISKDLSHDTNGIVKLLFELNIKNNEYRTLTTQINACDGNFINKEPSTNWQPIVPGSIVEALLKKSTLYLKEK